MCPRLLASLSEDLSVHRYRFVIHSSQLTIDPRLSGDLRTSHLCNYLSYLQKKSSGRIFVLTRTCFLSSKPKLLLSNCPYIKETKKYKEHFWKYKHNLFTFQSVRDAQYFFLGEKRNTLKMMGIENVNYPKEIFSLLFLGWNKNM